MKPPRPSRILVQIVGTAVALMLANAALSFTEHPWLLPSFGGSCVILFGMPRGIMAQPRSFIGGHLLATLVGIVCREGYHLLGGRVEPWIAFAVGAALAVMAVTRTIHSPAGANPVVVFAEDANWHFLATPLLPGLATVFLVAYVANNLPGSWGAGPWPRFVRWLPRKT
ncbi:HPP family protein [Roseomonas sp. HJA6]|uniref:HPP family protein n=1 Tax=Roseomonas alba TaxID=2846776 RepID=A0ABS7A1V0_9PROT|nr:HPP family protein [Neoroseomonas alba]MBW6396266.1 HPP family protein [Neoroseomonas alba]